MIQMKEYPITYFTVKIKMCPSPLFTTILTPNTQIECNTVAVRTGGHC